MQSSVKPNRFYIGSAMVIGKRWEQHLGKLKNNKHHSQKLQRHYNKYGKNDLIFSIIVGCDKSDLITTEQYFIDTYDPYFNGRKQAFTNGGFKLTDEQRGKISDSIKGEKNHNYGKHFSNEHRRKLSEAKKGISVNKGHKHTEETKRKISEAKKGKLNPHKGNRPSDAGILIIKEKLKGRIPWNKGKSNPHKGYPHSDEQKKKVSESLREYNRLKRMELIVVN